MPVHDRRPLNLIQDLSGRRRIGPEGGNRGGRNRVISGCRSSGVAVSGGLSGDYSRSKIDKVEQLNQKLKGWAQFYRHTDFTAKVYRKIDQIVFWKLARWLARKYRCNIRSLFMKWFK